MATATRTRKKTSDVRSAAKAIQTGKKKPRKEVASAPVNGHATNGKASRKKATGTTTLAGSDDDPDQTYIPGTEPPKDLEIEDVMAALIAFDDQAAEIRTERKLSRGKLTELMRDRKLTQYRFAGRIAKYKPGTDSVDIVQAPEK